MRSVDLRHLRHNLRHLCTYLCRDIQRYAKAEKNRLNICRVMQGYTGLCLVGSPVPDT